MKFLKKSIYALSLVSLLGLWSCSQEEMVQGDISSGEGVPLRITLNRGGDLTRTIVSENDENGGLNSVWKAGDKIFLYDTNGKKASEMTLKETLEGDASKGVFEGTMTGESGNYILWYYPSNSASTTKNYMLYHSVAKAVKFLFPETPFTTDGELAKFDVLKKMDVKIIVTSEKAAVESVVTMEPVFAMVRFSLKNLPGTTGTLKITNAASDKKIITGYALSLKTGELNVTTSDEVDRNTDYSDVYELKDVDSSKDIYLPFVPGDYQFGFEFVTGDNEVYKYQFEKTTPLEAGKYYNTFTEGADGAANTISGVEIPMVKEEATTAELHLNANFAGAGNSEITIENESGIYDLTLAYLAYKDKDTEQTLSYRNDGYTFVGWSKESSGETIVESVTLTEDATYYAVWAKNPLYKWAEGDLVYNKSTGKSTVAESYTTQGSLYQWGRNVGWSDYVDAMGTYEKLGLYTWYFATYGSKAYNSGTGLSQGSHQYDKVSILTNYKDMFFMNPSGTDYWVSSFGDGGSTWTERAKKCGWTGEAAPDGFRIAKIADFQEIYPSELSSYQTSGTLSSLLGHKEFKPYTGNDDLKVAWRWSSEKKGSKYYLRIDAKVVKSDLKDISSVNWSDNVSVMTRYFGAHGGINAFVHTNVYEQLGSFPVARPMPMTEIHNDKRVIESDNYYNYYTVVWQDIKDLSVNNAGYYWMADYKGGVFYFEDNSVAKGTKNYDGSYPFTTRKSMFSLSPHNPQNCAAIRCIHTDRE